MGGWLDALTQGHEVHLWHVAPDEVADEGLLAAYRALMTPAESERNGRFVFEKGRREHLIARALVRTTLSVYRPEVEARDWRFAIGPYGRPEIEAPLPGPTAPRLRFNLSHTDGLIVCLVAAERDIGVDVERTDRDSVGGIEIADRYFSPSEVVELRSLPPASQTSRFYDYWTLKEAYIKARGLGLHLPLDQFSFNLASSAGVPRRTIAISFGPAIQDDPASWQFGLMAHGPAHRLAVAIRRRPDESDLTLRRWPVVPLLSGPLDPDA